MFYWDKARPWFGHSCPLLSQHSAGRWQQKHNKQVSPRTTRTLPHDQRRGLRLETNHPKKANDFRYFKAAVNLGLFTLLGIRMFSGKWSSRIFLWELVIGQPKRLGKTFKNILLLYCCLAHKYKLMICVAFGNIHIYYLYLIELISQKYGR